MSESEGAGAPHAADLDRGRTRDELSSQTGPAPEPGVASTSRTDGSLQASYAVGLDRSRTHVGRKRRAVTTCPSRKERELHTQRTWTGAGPEMIYLARPGLHRSEYEPDGRELTSLVRGGP